jgi:ankyrin repeat protein
MIYALIGMVSDPPKNNPLQADYGKTIKQVIRCTVSTLLFTNLDTPCEYIDWGWSEFIEKLEILSSAVFSCAIRKGHKIAWSQFLELDDFDVNWKDEVQRTPLSWAASSGDTAVVKLLLGTGRAEVNSKDDEGQTPLLWAVQAGHLAVTELLLETGQATVIVAAVVGC